jgi:hypothetical protein
VRRRVTTEPVQPPPELLAYDPERWLPLVEPDSYEARSYGLEAAARRLWVEQRVAWARQHGWPDGSSGLDLRRQELQRRRQELQRRRSEHRSPAADAVEARRKALLRRHGGEGR